METEQLEALLTLEMTEPTDKILTGGETRAYEAGWNAAMFAVERFCTGQATKEIDAALFSSVVPQSGISDTTKFDDQHDGAGAHWR